VSESLEAACGQFEQVILGQMLRTAGIARQDKPTSENDEADDDSPEPASGDDAFSQLVTQSLAGAIERAGGIGLKSSLIGALERRKP
jgi:hypothetical protein